MNQSRTKPVAAAARLEFSMKMTDSPGAMWVIPLSGTESAKLSELSSIIQPVISTVVAPPLVTSNQSLAKGLLLLDHGATSEIKTETEDERVAGGFVGVDVGALTGAVVGDDAVGVVDCLTVPGEPVSVYPGLGLAELKAPFTPTTLNVEMVTPLRPAELSKVCRVGGGVEAPNVTLACGTPAALNRFTASPLVESPTPAPE